MNRTLHELQTPVTSRAYDSLTAALLGMLAGAPMANAADPQLQAYNADPAETTVSGISAGAGHAQVTLTAGLPCPSNETPYIDACAYDAAGKILQHMYGTLDPPIYSMGNTGYVYVPDTCAKMEPCRVHIALHFCL